MLIGIYGKMGLVFGIIGFIGACAGDNEQAVAGGMAGGYNPISSAGKGGATVVIPTQTAGGVKASAGKTGTTNTPKGGKSGTTPKDTNGGAGGSTAGAGGAAGSAGTTGGKKGVDNLPDGHCLKGITTYFADGPFQFDTKRSGSVNEYIPKVPAGCKVPMVHLNNGTGATCSYYATVLARLASNGFVALCYENANTGAGTYGMDALKTALKEYPDLIDMRIGSTGHSQGGMASFNTLSYAEKEWGDKAIYAGFAIEPASGFGTNPVEGWQTLYAAIKSPMFMFSGLGTDTLVSQGWVQQAYDAMDDATEAYFWTKSGANHIATSSPDTNEVIVPWFRWKLLGDQEACKAFKAIPTTDTTWAQVDVQNEEQCK